MYIKPQNTIFYLIEKGIKSYRRFAQSRLGVSRTDITINQVLVLEILEGQPEILHSELAHLVFKDIASISRMLTNLEKNGYITRDIDPDNRRRFITSVTVKGKKVLKNIRPVLLENRRIAIEGITNEELETCKRVLGKIIKNVVDA